jgi:hypothetical protein
MRYQVQQWNLKRKWWDDVQSFDNENDAKKFAATVKRSRVVTF